MLSGTLQLSLVAFICMGAKFIHHKFFYLAGTWWSPYWTVVDSAYHYAYLVLFSLYSIMGIAGYYAEEQKDRILDTADQAREDIVKRIKDLDSQIARYDVYFEVDRKRARKVVSLIRTAVEKAKELEEVKAFVAARQQVNEELDQNLEELAATQARIATLQAGIAQRTTNGQGSGML